MSGSRFSKGDRVRVCLNTSGILVNGKGSEAIKTSDRLTFVRDDIAGMVIVKRGGKEYKVHGAMLTH